MSDLLNKKNYLVFSNQCKGAGLTAIDVHRQEGGKDVRIKYRARDPRTGKMFQGEWVAPKKNGALAEASEKAFFELAEKEFAVTRRETAE